MQLSPATLIFIKKIIFLLLMFLFSNTHISQLLWFWLATGIAWYHHLFNNCSFQAWDYCIHFSFNIQSIITIYIHMYTIRPQMHHFLSRPILIILYFFLSTTSNMVLIFLCNKAAELGIYVVFLLLLLTLILLLRMISRCAALLSAEVSSS